MDSGKFKNSVLNLCGYIIVGEMKDYRSIAEEFLNSKIYKNRFIRQSAPAFSSASAFEADLNEIMHDFAAGRTLTKEQLEEMNAINSELLAKLSSASQEEKAV